MVLEYFGKFASKKSKQIVLNNYSPMEASSTIRKMLIGNEIFVPSYQRAYSWDTEFEKANTPKQTNVFLSDLEDYNKNKNTSRSPFYLGHFLFEATANNEFGIIDGQQRLTTIVILMSAIFTRLKGIRPLNDAEKELFEDIIKWNVTYRFKSVDYDNMFFKDYVIDQIKKNRNGIGTSSAKRIADCFDYYTNYLIDKEEPYLISLLDSISNASCTTHPVNNESEAIQMFIFQNNRGKKPSNLEILKAQFMFNVHLYAKEEERAHVTAEIKARFEKIYKSISTIEYRINEDDVLLYTLRVYFNSLQEWNALERVKKSLLEPNQIKFITDFTHELSTCFEHLQIFFTEDEKKFSEVHSIVTLGRIGLILPFVLKSYKFGLSKDNLNSLCSKLESLILRQRLIGTRADLTSRIKDVYSNFTAENPDIKEICSTIDHIKSESQGWWSYWCNDEFERSLQGHIDHITAKFLLWKYENFLEQSGKRGYLSTRFDKIESPELEHIAPSTENPKSGYDEYSEEFRQQYINCIGNYLLLSKSHNCSVGNKPFAEKRSSYNHSAQQREIQFMTSIDNPVWNKDMISKRKIKIVDFILTNF